MNRQKRKYIREILRQMVHDNYFSAVRVRADGWKRYWTTSCPVLHVKVNTIDFSEIAERVRKPNAFKELIDDLSAVRPQLVGLYKEQINDNGAMLSKDFFKPETHVHELGLRCMEVAGMLPKGGLAASKEDFDAFFENKPVEMLNDPANNGW